MESHSFLITFFRAHFKRHETRKFRSSYILPPPTVIWGIVGAFFGIERKELGSFARENSMIVGSELCSFKGLGTEKATLMPWDASRREFLRTVEDFEFLVEPTFRIAMSAKDALVRELKERIERSNFEFDVYGGITDYFLKNLRNESGVKFEKKNNVKGMIPTDLMKGFSKIAEGSQIFRVLYLNTFFYQGFNVEFEVKEPIKTVNNIAVWDVNDIERFRKGASE
jgi:CRISPR-associated protein Cas5 subtype I-B